MALIKFDVLNRFTGEVQFTAEIDRTEDALLSVNLGLAVKWAVKNGANLGGAYLGGAYLADANLADADLADADLGGANLADAYLAGAYLAGANAVIDAGVPNGYRIVAYQYNNTLMLQAGCKTFSADEAAEYWRDRPERAECVAALEYIRAVAKLRDWPTAN